MADQSPILPTSMNESRRRLKTRRERYRSVSSTSEGSAEEGRRSTQPRVREHSSGSSVSVSHSLPHKISRRRHHYRSGRSPEYRPNTSRSRKPSPERVEIHRHHRYPRDTSIHTSRSESRQSRNRSRNSRDNKIVAIAHRRNNSSYRSRSPVRKQRESNSPPEAYSSTAPNITVSQLVEALQVIKNGTNHDNLPLHSLQNVIPEFNPSREEQTIDMWLHKVNECAKIYNWSERQTIHYALPKLCGVAKKWYEGLDSVLFSWCEWQQKLRSAFPSDENYGQLLTAMLAKRARFGESLEDYFHEKVILLNRCNIVGKRAIDCIIFGVEDRGIRLGAEAAQFESTEKLLCYLRNAKGSKPNSNIERRKTKNFEQKAEYSNNRYRINNNNPKRPPITCYNCNEVGHYKSDCKKPIVKCDNCLLFGHLSEKCPDSEKKSIKPKAKTILTVTTNESLDNKYYKTAIVNGIAKQCFIDFGSHATIIKESESRNIPCDWNTESLPVLTGFGSGSVEALRKATLSIIIDGVEANVEVLVVPDDAMRIPFLIGQSFTEQSHIVFEKDSNQLNILLKRPKLNLICNETTPIKGLTAVRVLSNPPFTGVIYVEESFRFKLNYEHCLVQGIFSLNNGLGEVLIKGSAQNGFVLEKGTLIARGIPAKEDSAFLPELDVKNITESNHPPIDPKDLNVDSSVSASEIAELTTLLNKYRSCFAFNLRELGKTNAVEMSIKLKDDTPVVFRPYRLSVHERSQVRDMVEELQRNNIVRPSTSSYSSPIVLVKKKNGEVRMCVDYRALNRKTVKENYPLPRVDDQLDELAGYKYYTTLDLKSGYYQIQINEDDRHKTAFITPDGHFEFSRMPFGLVNAPAVFMRMINQVLGQARHNIASAYMDDIIIPSQSIADAMSRLDTVLKLLQDAGLTLNLSKCCFFRQNVDYLGFELSKDGIRPGSRKIEAVAQFPTPKDQHTIRQFIGLCSFFRRFINNFALIARPLTSLLKKDSVWTWGDDQDKAFEVLKSLLTNKPTLALYNPTANTEVHTDASKYGVAGILLQRDDLDRLRPVAYFSRQTTCYEQNMTAYELETLAVVSTLQRFRVYLIGREFKVITDCNSLRATFLKRDLIPRVARWWIALQEFNFTVEYRPGTSMNHVDALSRNAIPSHDSDDLRYTVMNVTQEDWLTTAQQVDPSIQQIVTVLNGPNDKEVADIKKNYVLKDSKLYRKTNDGDKWVVPKGCRWQIMKQNHDDIGHFGIDKSLAKIQASYWFPRMRNFVNKYVRSCLQCSYTKATANTKPPLNPIPKSNVPFDTIHVDHVGPFVKSSSGNTHILVIIEAYTKFICLKPVRNTSTNVTINKLKEYFSIFGAPKRLISDRGSCFTSTNFKKFSDEIGFKHILNAVATPRANGQVERYNRSLLEALTAKCVGEVESKWDSHVPEVQWGLNNTQNRGIGCTPSEALFGIKLRGISENKLKSYIDSSSLIGENSNITELRNKIDTHVKSYQEKQKTYHDSKLKATRKFNAGELVSIAREVPSSGQSRKLVPKFQGPYRVTNVLEHDRYIVEDTPITRKNNRKYSAVIAVDKMKPWLVFAPPHDSEDEDSDSEASVN